MTIIGNSLFNAGATVDTSKDGSAASFQAAIGTTYEIDLSLNDSAGETVVTFPSSPTRGDAFAVVLTGTGTERVVSFTGTVSGASVTAAYGMSRLGQYAIFRYFDATVGWLIHTNKYDVNNTIANGNTNLVLGSDNTCDARSTDGSMCVGHNNSATGYVDNIIVGASNSSNQIETVVFGANNTANGNYSVCLGSDNTATNTGAMAIGRSNTATGTQSSVSIGFNNTNASLYGTCIGQSNTVNPNSFNVCIGLNNLQQQAGTVSCVSVGFSNVSTTATGNNEVTMMGQNNTLSGDMGVVPLPMVIVGNQNTVSDDNSRAVVFGSSNDVTGASCTNTTIFGAFNDLTAEFNNACTLLGVQNEITGTSIGGNNLTVGNGNTITTSGSGYSAAVGHNNNNSGGDSYISGVNVTNTVDGVLELGSHSSPGARDGSMIRGDSTGLVQFSIEDSATPPADGGATLGSEAEGNLARGAFTIHKNGTAVTLYYNNAGTIESLSLGTLV